MKNLLIFSILLVIVPKAWTQTEGDSFFGTPVVHTLEFNFPYSNFTDSLTHSYDNDIYISVDVTLDGTLYTNCGVKWKGNSSYTFPGIKKSFKVDFNEFVSGQNHDGLKKINLNNGFKDPSFLREKLMLDFLTEHQLPAPRCTYVNVYINGTLWGLYTGVEEVDKTFLKRWFGEKKGNLFKGDPSGDLKWLGSSAASYYSKYELKTNETENNWTDLVHLLDVINNTPAGTYPSTLDGFFDTEKYIYTWAAHILFANLDSYPGSGHNYYIYHDSTANKFRFITWDVNEAFGNFNMGMTIPQLESLLTTYIPLPTANRPLHQKMLANGYQQDLYDAMCDLVNPDFSIWNMEWKIDSLANAIRPYVYADPNKFFTNTDFENNINNNITVSGLPGGGNIPGIKSFIVNRRNALAPDLAAHGCTVAVNENIPGNFDIYPNPVNNVLNLQGFGAQAQLIIYDAAGRVAYTQTLKSNNEQVDLSFLNQGLYFANIKNTIFEYNVNKTLIKH